LDYWSPTVNMQRDPRWGRNQEVPGEDPMLSARYATNYIQGIQEGEDANHVQIIATCKHFIANSLENWMGHTRHNFNAVVPAKDLADYYSVSFKACVTQGKALGIMCSYNAVNGVPMCANKEWLGTLRNTWGFDGCVCPQLNILVTMTHGHATPRHTHTYTHTHTHTFIQQHALFDQ
jgi:beta-glucosidase-like glycosyl hydrolase